MQLFGELHYSSSRTTFALIRSTFFSEKCTKCQLTARLYPDSLEELKPSPRPLSHNREKRWECRKVGERRDRKEGYWKLHIHGSVQQSTPMVVIVII